MFFTFSKHRKQIQVYDSSMIICASVILLIAKILHPLDII